MSKTGQSLNPKTAEEVAALEERHGQLTKLDAEIDNYVRDACSQGKASAACQEANAFAQGLQQSYEGYAGMLTYKELNREDYAKVSQLIAETSADKWDYAIENYATLKKISYQEAKDRFALVININQAADITGIIYALKGSGSLKNGISSATASTLKQLMTKYDEFKQNIANSTKGNNDTLAMAGAGNVNGLSSVNNPPSNVNSSTGKGTGTNIIPQGEAGLVGSKVIQPNTTVRLTENTTLPNGEVIPKGSAVTVSDNTMKVTYPDGTSKISNYNKVMSSPSALPDLTDAGKGTTGTTSAGQTGNAATKQIVNPATNTVVTDHIIVPSGKAPKTSTPNSVYEVSRADGTKSVTYYDDKGRMFSREDYGQQRTHGELGYDSNGKVPPHEHKTTYNDRGFKDKSYYREIDANGKAVGPWILEK